MLTSRRSRAAVSLGLALVASLILAFAPLGAQTSARPAVPGTIPEAPEVTHPSLVETEGWRIVLPLAVPVAIAGAGVVSAGVGRARVIVIAAALLLAGWVVLGLASIGLFYVPAAAMMGAAAMGPDPA